MSVEMFTFKSHHALVRTFRWQKCNVTALRHYCRKGCVQTVVNICVSAAGRCAMVYAQQMRLHFVALLSPDVEEKGEGNFTIFFTKDTIVFCHIAYAVILQA